MNKKGQAALEFLTTYGWAFLVILVMIGALAYFGVLDPTKFLPQRCQFGAEMHCERFALDSATGGAYFELKNALPSHVYVVNLTWSVPEGAQIVSGQGTHQIAVDWGILGGDVIADIVTGDESYTIDIPVTLPLAHWVSKVSNRPVLASKQQE